MTKQELIKKYTTKRSSKYMASLAGRGLSHPETLTMDERRELAASVLVQFEKAKEIQKELRVIRAETKKVVENDS